MGQKGKVVRPTGKKKDGERAGRWVIKFTRKMETSERKKKKKNRWAGGLENE